MDQNNSTGPSDEQTMAESLRLIRLLRHDWMNEIQIIWTCLQLNKPDRALKQLQLTQARATELNRVTNLDFVRWSWHSLCLAIEFPRVQWNWSDQMIENGSKHDQQLSTLFQIFTVISKLYVLDTRQQEDTINLHPSLQLQNGVWLLGIAHKLTLSTMPSNQKDGADQLVQTLTQLGGKMALDEFGLLVTITIPR